MRLKDKVAIITGGGSGIGEASALKLAAEGAKVCVMDIEQKRADEVKRRIEQNGGEVMALEVDVADPEQVKAAIDKTVGEWDRLDIVFSNAGINGTVTPIEDLSPDDWDQTLSTNLKGTFLLTKYAIPHMKNSGGSIIITSSINGNRIFSNIGMSAYSSSKAGQVAFMKMAALELARYKIRVNAVCPGAIETKIEQNTNRTEALEKVQIPVEFPEGDQPISEGTGKPEQVADLVLFLASDDSSHISGTDIYIDGTESLLRG
ncbi:SDR family oxidoreductase [Heyndrickxia coagulans]|uniref:SDR family oxidoreductase n=1 Tax=Heyndrickxia coagulans TaxID=1398 RepID=UPI000210FE66|nr:SDR family NAD(P)-dependent oxidoreductase [Heyndrickxia coagulans]AEH54194.1 short-chain dehydrogenase/reductase SDR [Heyndrickxia coagulans 2-6]